MSTLFERLGHHPDHTTLRPADRGMSCKESDVIDIATELPRHRNLTSLDLTGSQVSVEAAKALATVLTKSAATNIQYLNLSSCDVHADAAQALAAGLLGNDRLEILDLSKNPIRDDGAAALADLLRGGQILRSIDLSACRIGPSGARALGSALAQNLKLRTLNLSTNKLCAAGVIGLCNGLKKNAVLRVLDLSENNVNSEGGMALAELVAQHEALESLNLALNYLSDSLPKLGKALSARKCPTRLVDLTVNQIDEATCRRLAQTLEGNRVTVACLSLEGNAIGDEGLVPLYHALKGTSIQFLDFSSCGLSHRSGVVLSDLITACPSLNSLQLDGNPLGDDAVVEIASAFAKAPALEAINLERTAIGPRSATALAEAVAGRASQLRSLNLAENARLDAAAIAPLLTALHTRSKLEELDLSNLPLAEDESLLTALVQLFSTNKRLGSVVLEHTEVGAAVPQGMLTRELAAHLAGAAGLPPTDAADGSSLVSVAGTAGAATSPPRSRPAAGTPGLTTSAAVGTDLSSAGSGAAAVAQPKYHTSRNAETIFKPAWALSVPISAKDDADQEPEDGAHVPLVPHPQSLHDQLYPGYAQGRFSNQCLVQNPDSTLPFNISNTLGPGRAFIHSGDGRALLRAPPRRALKEPPYSLRTLENNPGQLPVTEDQLRRKFSELDVDGNGYLDREEFKKLYVSFQSFGLPPSPQEIESTFRQFSGVDQKLQFDEFCVLMLRLASR